MHKSEVFWRGVGKNWTTFRTSFEVLPIKKWKVKKGDRTDPSWVPKYLKNWCRFSKKNSNLPLKFSFIFQDFSGMETETVQYNEWVTCHVTRLNSSLINLIPNFSEKHCLRQSLQLSTKRDRHTCCIHFAAKPLLRPDWMGTVITLVLHALLAIKMH